MTYVYIIFIAQKIGTTEQNEVHIRILKLPKTVTKKSQVIHMIKHRFI